VTDDPRILRHATFWPFASRIQLGTVNLEGREEREPSKRGKCGSFGRKSRARLLQYMATVRHDVLPWFLTLTYPNEWPLEWDAWKAHLDRFAKNHLCRSGRTPVRCGGIWKLEPQKRGAPHFHAILYGRSDYDIPQLSLAWSKVIGTNCPHHPRYGLKLEPARSIRGVMAYAGKKYLGKEVELPPGWSHVGRYWGVFGRRHVPVSASVSCSLTAYGWHRVRRLMRRAVHSRGRFLDMRSRNFFTQNFRQWERAFAWAEGEAITQADFTAQAEPERALASQPF